MDIIFTSLNAYNVAVLIARLVLGAFFTISGYNKLMDKGRHQTLVQTLQSCHIPFVSVMQWFVPGVEFSAGIALAFGLLTYPSAAGLFAICLVATCTDGCKRVAAWNPINLCDCVDDYLYLPEVMYMTILVVICVIGPGLFSMDHLIHYILWG